MGRCNWFLLDIWQGNDQRDMKHGFKLVHMLVETQWLLLTPPILLVQPQGIDGYTNMYIYTGWWLTYPSEKYESQLGLLFPTYGKTCSKPPTSIYITKKTIGWVRYFHVFPCRFPSQRLDPIWWRRWPLPFWHCPTCQGYVPRRLRKELTGMAG